MVVVMLIGWYIFFVAGGALVLTSGAGRSCSAPVVPIFRSRSRRESAATASADLLAALHVVHDGRGHFLYRVPYLQLLIRCLLLLLLLLLLRNKYESVPDNQRFIMNILTFRFKLIPARTIN